MAQDDLARSGCRTGGHVEQFLHDPLNIIWRFDLARCKRHRHPLVLSQAVKTPIGIDEVGLVVFNAALTLPAQTVIPNRFSPVVRDREGEAAANRLDQVVLTIGRELGLRCVGSGLDIDRFWIAAAASGRINIHAVTLAGFEQFDLARRQLVFVFVDVASINAVKRFVAGEWVVSGIAQFVFALGQSTAPFGNSAVLVCRFFSTDGCELFAQLGGLLFAHGGH